MCILTILRMHYRPKNGKAELRTLGIFSSWFCLLAAPLSVSPHSAFAVMQSTLQKASRHPAYGGLAVHSGGGGFGKGQAQAEARIPVAAAARAVCPACPVLPIGPGLLESARPSSTGMLQSLYPPFLLPCLGLGRELAGIRLVPKQRGGWQDLEATQAPYHLSSLSAS